MTLKRFSTLAIALSVFLVMARPVLAQVDTPTDTPTETPTDTPTDTPTVTPSDTPTETPTSTPTDTASATPADTPTETATATPTDTPSETPTDTPSNTPADTATPVDTATSTPTNSPSSTPTDTPTGTPVDTATATPTETATSTPTETPTATPTDTPTTTPTESPTATPTDTPSVTPTATTVAFSISKTDNPDPVPAGQQLTYVISYSNVGTQPATAVVITETYDPTVTFVSANPPPDIGTNNQWTVGTVFPGPIFQISVVVQVQPATLPGTVLSNTVDIANTLAGAQAVQTTLVVAALPTATPSPTNTPVPGAPTPTGSPTATSTPSQPLGPSSLTFSLSGGPRNPRVDVNQGVTYQIRLSNPTAATVSNIDVTDQLPAGLEFATASPPPTSMSATGPTWSFPSLLPGNSLVIILRTNLSPTATAGMQLTDVATLADSTGRASDQFTGTTRGAQIGNPKLSVSITGVHQALAGTQPRFTLDIDNAGTADAHDVVLTLTFPADIQLVSALPGPTTSTATSATWNFGTVPSPGKARLRFTLNLPDTLAAGRVLHLAASLTDSVGHRATDTADVTVRN